MDFKKKQDLVAKAYAYLFVGGIMILLGFGAMIKELLTTCDLWIIVASLFVGFLGLIFMSTGKKALKLIEHGIEF